MIGFPMLVVRLVQDVYGIVDSFWLSRYHQFAIAVPRQVWPSYSIFTAFVMSFVSANIALLSQYAGAALYEEFSNTASKLVFVSTSSGFLFGTLFYILTPPIFTYIVATPIEIYDEVLAYARVMSVDIVFLSVNMALATIIQALGDTRAPALSQVAGGIANAFLDPIFIMGLGTMPAMGAAGAALATVLSKVISLVMMLQVIRKRYAWLKLRIDWNMDRNYLYSSLPIALPLLVMNISNSLAFNMQNRLVNIFGSIAASALSIGFIVFDLANTSLWGLTEGITIMVGQNLGAGNSERAKRVAKRTSAFIFLAVFVTAAIVYMLKDLIILAFITGQGVSQEDVNQILFEVNRFLSITIWTLPFFALTFSSISVGRGSGHTTMPTAINILRLWGLRVGLGYIMALALGLGTLGIYMAFAASNVIGGIISILWVSWGRWAKPVISEAQKGFAEVREVKTPVPVVMCGDGREHGGCSSKTK
jgi:putative MATE family efflux protein